MMKVFLFFSFSVVIHSRRNFFFRVMCVNHNFRYNCFICLRFSPCPDHVLVARLMENSREKKRPKMSEFSPNLVKSSLSVPFLSWFSPVHTIFMNKSMQSTLRCENFGLISSLRSFFAPTSCVLSETFFVSTFSCSCITTITQPEYFFLYIFLAFLPPRPSLRKKFSQVSDISKENAVDLKGFLVRCACNLKFF